MDVFKYISSVRHVTCSEYDALRVPSVSWQFAGELEYDWQKTDAGHDSYRDMLCKMNSTVLESFPHIHTDLIEDCWIIEQVHRVSKIMKFVLVIKFHNHNAWNLATE